MKQRFIYVFLFFGMLFVSCSTDKNSKEFMVNSWQTTYLKIEMPTHQKSDSLNVY